MEGFFETMNSLKNIFLVIAVLAVAVMIIFMFAGCSGERYKIEYNNKFVFLHPKKSAKAGEEVTLIFKEKFIAVDAGYTFYADGKVIDAEFCDKGIKLRFIMPEHDVKISYDLNTSMSPYIPEGPDYTNAFDVILIGYYEETFTEEGTEYYEISLSTTKDPLLLKLKEYVKVGGEESEKERNVSCYAFEDLLHVIEVNEMRHWNKLEESESIDGIEITVKFRLHDEEFCVSSKKMPEDGMSVFAEIRRLLSGIMTE